MSIDDVWFRAPGEPIIVTIEGKEIAEVLDTENDTTAQIVQSAPETAKALWMLYRNCMDNPQITSEIRNSMSSELDYAMTILTQLKAL